MISKEDFENYKKEYQLGDNPDSLSYDQLNHSLNQMKLSICKIKNDKNIYGTGFFCKIPFPNPFSLLPVLITCNHILDINDISKGKTINFSLDNEKIKNSILINQQRKTYTNTKYDATIIEIKPEADKINYESFLDLDENIYKNSPNEIYKDKSAYILHYEGGKNMKYSIGKIKIIGEDNFTICHLCTTQTGSSGGPIINLFNYKVLGVHKGSKGPKNLGTLLKIVIDDFNIENKNLKNNPIMKAMF